MIYSKDYHNSNNNDNELELESQLELKKVEEKEDKNNKMTSSDSYSNRSALIYNSNRARKNSCVYEKSISIRETARLSLTDINTSQSITSSYLFII
jgi:hypothetical protein